MESNSIRVSIPSRLEAVPPLGAMVKALCASRGLPQEDCSRIELCIVEAINNSIRHAYLSNPNRIVDLVIDLGDDQLAFKVIDRGKSADPATITSDRRHLLETNAADIQQIPHGGRGLAIIQNFMDGLEYTTSAGVNTLLMTKRLPVIAARSK
jgi:serine/threonine-protein kinase RsbW